MNIHVTDLSVTVVVWLKLDTDVPIETYEAQT